MVANKAYLFKVRAVSPSASTSAYSPPDIATTVVFTDDPIQAGVTNAKAAHINEVRTAVNLVRALAALTAASWAESVDAGVLIRASHITEIRAALDPARSALGLPAIGYTDPALAAGDTIKAAHIRQLRDGVK